jgi:hypothetical protein
MLINSQGKPVDPKFLQDKEKERAYLAEVIAILDKRDLTGGIMTDELIAEYKSVLLKHGMISKKED